MAHIFISYTRADLSKRVATELFQKLDADGYTVFYDVESLRRGEKWADRLYDEIHKSDVLIVLLEAKTADSDWVQREVDVARGAYVSIMPLPISGDTDFTAAMQKLALSEHQFEKYNSTDHDFRKLVEDIERLAKLTKEQQRNWIAKLNNKWRTVKADDVQSYKRFKLRDSDHPATIHLATGDMTKVSGIDVLVNTENDYMQMARVHETDTISSVLRYMGSKVNRAGSVQEDTVQDELNDQICAIGYRPIIATTVLPTNAGHASSDLRRKSKARYIFHVAAVMVNHGKSAVTLKPVDSDEGIISCVSNCLDELLRVNTDKGIISPEDSPRYAEEVKAQGKFKPVSSIIFPLFGTGRGGRATAQVVPPMAQAISKFLQDEDTEKQITDVYIDIYAQSDVALTEEMLGEIFEEIK